MIRAIKTDHDIDPEWSRLGFHVVLDITLTCLYFATYILEFKIGFDHGLQLVNNFLDFPQNIQNANLGILPVYIFICLHSIFNPHFACSS